MAFFRTPLPWGTRNPRGCPRRGGAGFSLVEVVLALGILSFALVGLLGITAVGATASRESKRDTQSSQVFTQIVGLLRTKPFDAAQAAEDGAPTVFPLPALNVPGASTEFYLDDQNRMAAEAVASRKVRVTVWNAAVLAGMNPPLPANAQGRQGEPAAGALAFVCVEVEPHPAGAGSGSQADVYYTEICPLQQ